MDAAVRPVIRCLVSFPVEPHPEWYTEPALVCLDVAAELQTRGYMVLVDPSDERDLAMYERLERAVNQQRSKRWFER